VTWPTLIWRNLFRRAARTILTAVGVGLGVALIVALLATSNGLRRTAGDLTHVGRSDFGLFQADASDVPRSLLPESLAEKVAREPGVGAVARVKLLIVGETLVFGLDPREFAYRRLVVIDGTRAPVMAGNRSGKHLGDVVRLGGRAFTVAGIYHSGDRFEDLGIVLPLRTVERLAQRPGDVTSIGVNVMLGQDPKALARRLEARFPGVAAITEPGQAIKVDTSTRLIVSMGWIASLLALIVGGMAVMNTMAMSVFERTREIGILRAVGWSSLRIGSMIVSEALCVVLLALGVGCALGVAGAEAFVRRSTLSGFIAPEYSASTFAWGLAFALGVGLLGALYPAWRAVRLAPVAALRHE
jgi:putative ABC transport system permease protein